MNELSFSGAHWLKEELLRTGLFEDPFPGKPFLKEFMLRSLIPVEELQKHLWDAGFFAALQTAEGYVDFCVTEKHDTAELQKVVDTVKSIK